MDDTFYDKELDLPYDCEFCNDTGKLEGSDHYDCGHCGVAQERVALEQRVMPGVRFDNVADVLYREVRLAKRTAQAIAAAEMALLKSKLLQAERELAEVRKDAERYRWLRTRDVTFEGNDGPQFVSYAPELGHDGSNLDAQIDAAILAAKEQA